MLYRSVLVLMLFALNLFAFDMDKYEKAALKGNVKAMVTLGKLYYAGKEIPQDYKKSFYYFSKAVSKGNTHAKVMLALLYQEGKGTGKNLLMTMKLLKEASKSGDKLSKEWVM
jgi:TPR repeat protein